MKTAPICNLFETRGQLSEYCTTFPSNFAPSSSRWQCSVSILILLMHSKLLLLGWCSHQWTKVMSTDFSYPLTWKSTADIAQAVAMLLSNQWNVYLRYEFKYDICGTRFTSTCQADWRNYISSHSQFILKVAWGIMGWPMADVTVLKLTELCSCFRILMTIVTDNGSWFTGSVFAYLCN